MSQLYDNNQIARQAQGAINNLRSALRPLKAATDFLDDRGMPGEFDSYVMAIEQLIIDINTISNNIRLQAHRI